MSSPMHALTVFAVMTMPMAADSGGHLAGARDLAEAIRAGLGDGNGTQFVHTSDLVIAEKYTAPWWIVSASTTRTLTNAVVKWQTVDTAFTGLYPTYMTVGAGINESRPFRCVWTNELR